MLHSVDEDIDKEDILILVLKCIKKILSSWRMKKVVSMILNDIQKLDMLTILSELRTRDRRWEMDQTIRIYAQKVFELMFN